MHQHLRQLGAVRLVLGLVEHQLHGAAQASRIFGDQVPSLIPLGVIFIVMVIFLPPGLRGFAKRGLNR